MVSTEPEDSRTFPSFLHDTTAGGKPLVGHDSEISGPTTLLMKAPIVACSGFTSYQSIVAPLDSIDGSKGSVHTQKKGRLDWYQESNLRLPVKTKYKTPKPFRSLNHGQHSPVFAIYLSSTYKPKQNGVVPVRSCPQPYSQRGFVLCVFYLFLGEVS